MTELIALASEIVSAFVSHNSLPSGELGALLGEVHSRLETINSPKAEPVEVKPEAATSVKKSIRPDYLICLHCGAKLKSMRRHLNANHQETPDQYRATFNLPRAYPMVAPNYAATRSALAKASGLGVKTEKPEPVKPAAKRGRPRKTS